MCHTKHWPYLISFVVSWIQFFPGRPMVMNLLKSLNAWLLDQPGDEISYEALEKIIDNKAQVSPDRVWTFLLRTEYHFSREHNRHPQACKRELGKERNSPRSPDSLAP